MSELDPLIKAWRDAVGTFTQMAERLRPEQWNMPTHLPGWDVHDVVAHTAHLEALLAGTPHDDVEIGSPPHVRNTIGRFAEQGVAARRGRSPRELLTELEQAVASRDAELRADPPADGDAPAPGLFGALGWSLATLLSNRPLDVWLHEQDIRAAIGSPGSMDTLAADHTTDVLLRAVPMVIGKRVAPPPGTIVVIEVRDSAPACIAVDGDGRARLLHDVQGEPAVTIRTDRLTFVLLAGGRGHSADQVELFGDAQLGRRILGSMAVTP